MKRAVLALLVLGALGLGTARLLRGAVVRAPSVATHTVTKASFVRRVSAEGNLRAVKTTRVLTPRGAGGLKLAWLAPDGSAVKAGEVVARFDPSEPEKRLRDGRSDLDAAEARQRSEEVKARVAVAGRDHDREIAAEERDRMRDYQHRDPDIYSRNQLAEAEADAVLADAKQRHAESTSRIERKVSQSNRDLIQVERRKAELAVQHATTALRSMEITAPTDGIFVIARDWRNVMIKVGDTLWPGQNVAEIPVLDEMEAMVFVLEVDANGLAEGQRAQVVIDARPERPFSGKIRAVEKLAQPRQPGSPVQYFGVVIALDRTEREVMKTGQRVRATVELSRDDALVVPRQAVVERGGHAVVFRRGPDGTFAPVPVELGPATSGRVVVTRGISVGDVIALRDPSLALDGTGSGSGSGSAQERAP